MASFTMSAYLGPLGAAAAFGAIIMYVRKQKGQQVAWMCGNEGTLLELFFSLQSLG